MTKIVLLTLLALCLALEIVGLKLEQCPPGFRCRKRTTSLFMRSVIPKIEEEEMEVEICEAGTYSPGGADECTPCEKGTYAAKPGAPACYFCPKGHMCPRTDAVPEQCPLGTYNNISRQTCCRVCEPGKFALLKGMFQCDDCPSGYRCRARAKLPCEDEAMNTTTTTTTRTSESTTTRTATPTVDEETVTGVLKRHNWTDIGAVVDVTGSMAACYAQIDQWLALSHTNKLVQYFVFFNDGDNKPNKDKVIGSTGGIYAVHTNEGIAKVLTTLDTAKKNGGGGDGPENDIEAIIYTIGNCSTCENIIHIADNQATPRDLILLDEVTKPIKVIVCKYIPGTLVNPKLLDIAYKTGGSLHTLDLDIETLGSLKVDDTIQVGTGTYRLDVTGFIRIA
ncbi:unnamed protein product [Rotaria magnacalcarata]|uniref:Tyrosine-protein kinase ephrin type A/B receptor-like domain-containing protein n=5 Tax=Rotaria magnacalcarata TaxID=392030 RepID=A0A815AT89_9BILA|nr:unnamed protein product [Rotaria magnacalcarata]